MGGHNMLKAVDIRVSPGEIEACLIHHPSVLECAVVSSRDEKNLVKSCAYIVLNKGFSPSKKLEKELKTYVKIELPHYISPWQVYFVDKLPKTATGKLKRVELKTWRTRRL